MNAIIKKVEASYMRDDVNEDVEVGDVVEASLKVKEGTKERIQKFEGIVIAIKGEGISKAILIRKHSFGIGVEKQIPLHAGVLKEIVIKKKSFVRRAKLYYMRDRVGKKATRLAERKS